MPVIDYDELIEDAEDGDTDPTFADYTWSGSVSNTNSKSFSGSNSIAKTTTDAFDEAGLENSNVSKPWSWEWYFSFDGFNGNSSDNVQIRPREGGFGSSRLATFRLFGDGDVVFNSGTTNTTVGNIGTGGDWVRVSISSIDYVNEQFDVEIANATTATNLYTGTDEGFLDSPTDEFKNIGYGVDTAASGNTATGVIDEIYSGFKAPISGLGATVASGTQIDLSWTDDDSGEKNEDDYEVYTGQASGSLSLETSAGADATTYSHTSLENGEQYFYRVDAIRGDYTTQSSEVSATTDLPAPTLDTLTVAADDLTAAWTQEDNSSDGDYLIENSTDGGSSYSTAGTKTVGTTEHTDTDLQDTTTYTYRVTRRTDHATSASNTLDATTEELTFTNIRSQSVAFAYQDPDSFTQNGFRIYREQEVNGSFASQNQIADVSDTTTDYTDPDIIPGKTYRYTVEPYDGNGAGPTVSGTATALGGDQRPRIKSKGWSVEIDI